MKILRIIALMILFMTTDLKSQDLDVERFDYPYKHALWFAQSDDGFIWMGHHYGLIRFDGSNYKFFKHDPKDSTSIPSGLIMQIFHKDNYLWLCSVTGGVSAFDLTTYKSKTWKSIPNDSLSLTSNNTRGVWPENDTSVWVTSSSFCLNHLNPTTSRLNRYYPPIPDVNIESNQETGLLSGPTPDPHNDQYLWLGSKFGLYRFDKTQKTFKLFTDEFNPVDPSSVRGQIKPLIDKQGIIWTAWIMNQLPGKGLIRLDPKLNKWKTFKYTNATVETSATNRLTQLYEFNDSILLIGARTEKLWYFNKRKGEIKLPSNKFQKRLTRVPQVYALLNDQSDQTWLASSDLFRIRKAKKQFDYHSTSSFFNTIKDAGWTNCMAEDPELKQIYIGSQNAEGFLIFNDEFELTGQFLNGEHHNIKSINDILVLDNHEVMLATDKGLYVYNPSQKKVLKIDLPDLDQISIGRIKKINDEKIWLVVNGEKLVSYNKDETNPEVIFRSIPDSGFSDLEIKDIAISDSLIWLGCNNGLFKYNILNDSFEYVEALSGVLIYDLEVIGDSLYVGTSTQGLIIHSLNKDSSSGWDNYTELDGISGQQVFEILALKDGSIWLGSEPGFTQYIPIENRFIQFHVEDGVGFNRQNVRLVQLHDGRVLSSSSSGFYSFNPDSLEKNRYKPVAYIDEIKIAGKEGFRPPPSLMLESGEGSFSIIFGATDYCTRIKTRYEYLLENYDDAWRKKMSSEAIEYNKLPYGRFTFKLVAINSKGVRSDVLDLPITIKTPFIKTIWFWAVLLAISILIIGVFYKVRLNQIRREEKIKTEFNKKIATLEMETLRSQMNPHFLFNSLNSINRFIIKKDPKLASDYLTKFARLIRMILNNSKQESITLEEEINTLRLYIEMEKLRFDGKFDFEIKLLSNQHSEDLYVPSMIVQPYIENAIWHGLMHKKDDRHLTINIKVEKSHILFEIIDNGVGRKRAQELKSKSSTHKLFGMKITKNRIKLINSKNESKASVHVEDLFDDYEFTVGTKVNLKLPIIKIHKAHGKD